MTEQITPTDALEVLFRTTKFRSGYDVEEVDDFIDRVIDALRAHEAGASPSLRGAEVAAHTFRVTKFREGYEPEQVDAFMAKVVASLGHAEAKASGGTQAYQPPVSTVTAVSTAAPVATIPAAPLASLGQPIAGAAAPIPPEFPRATSLEPILGLREVTTQLQMARIRTGLSDDVVVLAPDGTRLRISSVNAASNGVEFVTTRV